MQGESLTSVMSDRRISAARDVIGVSLARTLYRSGDMKYIEQGLSRDALRALGYLGEDESDAHK